MLLLAIPATANAWSARCCTPWDTPGQLAVTPDGKHAYAADYAVTLLFDRDPATGQLAVNDSYDGGGGGALELAADGKTLYELDIHNPSLIRSFQRDPESSRLAPPTDWKPFAYSRFTDLEASADGLWLYALDPQNSRIVALSRNPATGALSQVGELGNLSQPHGLAISPDGRFVYTTESGNLLSAITWLARDSQTGQLTRAGSANCSCAGDDVEISPDGSRIYTGPIGPAVLTRNQDDGSVTLLQQLRDINSGWDWIEDGTVRVAPDGRFVYVIDWENSRIYQYGVTEAGLAIGHAYRDGTEGMQGLKYPRAFTFASDTSLYLTSGYPSNNGTPGTVVAFVRDPATGGLAFGSIFTGLVLDGRPPRDQLPLSVTINGGAPYTNDPNVTLTITRNPRTTNAFEVANDGGFVGGRKVEAVSGDRYPWRLAETGPERLAKTVYVRGAGFGPDNGTIVKDDIVLDQTAPVISAARVRAARVRVRAYDRASGLHGVQLTRNRSHPGRWRAFHSTLAAPHGHAALHVRVRDGAGNMSRWRRVAK